MDEIIYYTELYDIYKGLFTINQRAIFEDYFFENLTLEEIALERGVSKNAISKTIKQIKASLYEYEKSLKFKKYIHDVQNEFKNEEDILIRLAKYDNIIK